ncbi:MAG: hypothetical protein NTU83_03680 [Candidatus Hydrogenedentes bacterium]|nr:hypothetical protein [Candidatus Hydrogenedentota bacterium]
MPLSGPEMHEIFRRTEIIRRPTYGIVSGYHELPYVCLGEACKRGFITTEVRGRVQVSPRFVLRPSHFNPTYGEVFGEENVDRGLTGRMFGFLGFRDRPVECKSEYISVKHLEESIEATLAATLDELDRREDITTGVIITPNSHYYPVSVERFIATILEDEFNA